MEGKDISPDCFVTALLRQQTAELCGPSNNQFLGEMNGAQGRDRTTDTAIFSRMLYQLSYLGTGPWWQGHPAMQRGLPYE